MDKFYDGIDFTLESKLIQICYFIEGVGGSVSTPVNVYANDTQIKFGWLLPEELTALERTITVGICVIGTEGDKDYVLKTDTTTYKIYKDSILVVVFQNQMKIGLSNF